MGAESNLAAGTMSTQKAAEQIPHTRPFAMLRAVVRDGGEKARAIRRSPVSERVNVERVDLAVHGCGARRLLCGTGNGKPRMGKRPRPLSFAVHC